MMEITAVGMGMMMTAVAIAAGGLLLEGTLAMMCRALRTPPVELLEPVAIHLN